MPLPRFAEPPDLGSALLLLQDPAHPGANGSADNNTGKAAPWQTQGLRQAELSIWPRSLKRLIKDKKKQTKEKRELMDMS